MPDDDARDDSGEAEDVDPAFYAKGGVSLSEEERVALGDLHSKRVLVLGAGNGEDALSLLNLGAEVTVVDEVEAMVEAKALAQAAHQPVRFVEGSPSSIPAAVRSGGFDAVYSGFGGLDWVPDLDAWAEGIRASLETGGALVVYDEHPFAFMVAPDDGRLGIGASYFGPEGDEDDEDADEPNWTLGDIVTALGSHGFHIQSLLEFHESERFATVLDEMEDVPEDYLAYVPGVFLLAATKLA